jgi:hypothetical protein
MKQYILFYSMIHGLYLICSKFKNQIDLTLIMRLSSEEEDMGVSSMPIITTPKASDRKQKFRDSVSKAPCSLKQQCSNQKDCEEANSEVLNICCGGFNSLLFLSPPKIRSTVGMQTPSPAKTEASQQDSLMESALPKDLMDMINSDFESVEIPAPVYHMETGQPLQNITNRDYNITNDQSCDSSSKKKSNKAQFKFPEGGWVCIGCQNYNFSGRVKCNRCGKSKTKDDPVGKPKHLLRKENDENDPSVAAKTGKGPKKQLRERAGDWICLSCRNINFAFRQQCNRCKLDKELIGTAFDAQPSAQPAVWNTPFVNGCYPMPNMGYCPQTIPYGFAPYAMVMQGQQMVYPSGM